MILHITNYQSIHGFILDIYNAQFILQVIDIGHMIQGKRGSLSTHNTNSLPFICPQALTS